MKEKEVIKIKQESGILQTVIILAAACVVHGIMQGVRDNYGVMMNSILEAGISYAEISFCIGVGALVYGVAQPFLGMLALRKSNTFVMMTGIISIIIGLIATPLCKSFFPLLLFFGLLLPFGTTGLCFGIVMGAITPVIGERRAAMVSGIVQASAGIGNTLMSPALVAMISGVGFRPAMDVIAIPFVAAIPITLWIGMKNKRVAAEKPKGEEKKESLFEILRDAVKDRDYRLILLGFSTCGFNMTIIESHLFSQYLSYGISETAASFTLTVYGIATMIGATMTGFLGVKFQMKNVLGCTYGVRTLISIGFLLLPKSVPFAFIATALLGLSGDSTVPPTSGIITRNFGARKMAVLYGFAMIGHQVGAFISANLGGLLVEMGYGYAPLWGINMCLTAMAATASFMISKEEK